MYLRSIPVRGHAYWMVAEAHRTVNRPREKRLLYLGRLDSLTPGRRTELERKVLALRDDKVLHAFYAQLAEYGHPVPRPPLPGLLEEGPFLLAPVDFATLSEALRQGDLTPRDLSSLIDRMGLPVRAEELAAIGVRVDLVKKTRSLSLFYRATSPRLPPAARRATGNSRSRRRSGEGSVRSARP